MADIKEVNAPSDNVVLAAAAPEKTIVYGDLSKAVEDPSEEYLCDECDTPVPPKRVQLVGHTVCVHCMSEKEKNGTGTVRHRMDQILHTKNGEEIEEIETVIVRGK